MKCKKFRKQIPAYLMSECNEEVIHAMENHRRQCSACSELLVKVEKAMELLSTEETVKASDGFFERLENTLHRRKQKSVQIQSAFSMVYATSAVAASLFVGVFLGNLLMNTTFSTVNENSRIDPMIAELGMNDFDSPTGRYFEFFNEE